MSLRCAKCIACCQTVCGGGLLSLRAFRSYVFCLRAAKLSGAAPRYEPSGQRVYDAPPAVFLYIRARTRQRRKEAAP